MAGQRGSNRSGYYRRMETEGSQLDHFSLCRRRLDIQHRIFWLGRLLLEFSGNLRGFGSAVACLRHRRHGRRRRKTPGRRRGLDLGHPYILCFLPFRSDRRRNCHIDGFLETKLASSLAPIMGDLFRNLDNPRTEPALYNCSRAKEFNVAVALWNSYRHWNDYLFYLYRNAAMNLPTLSNRGCHEGAGEPVQNEKLGRPGWTGCPMVSRILSIGEVKLEKVCRICRRQRRRGAAAVEFAIVAPVFFLLVFGMIEYGRMVMVQQVLTNASREGARVGVLDPPTGQTSLPLVTSTVNSYLASASITGATITTVPTEPSTATYGQSVTVKVSVPFGNVSWLPTSMFGNGGKILSASTVMRRETVQ
jgi:Flp pilus assembly protein TadG